MKWTDADGEILADVAAKVGLDPYKVKSENPHKFSGKTANLLKMGAAEFYPEANARWRSEVSSISAGTVAECRSDEPLSQRAMQDLWDHDPAFVREVLPKPEEQFQADLKALEKGAAEKRLKNMLLKTGGDERQAKRLIEAEDAANAQHQQQRAGALR